MNNVEFSNQFDTLWNNINSNQAPGLNEYEKSVFLTKAQDEVLKNYFNPKSNPKQEGYDDSIKRQADFSGLMREDEGIIYDNPSSKFDPRSIVYKIPTEVYLIINEQILLQETTQIPDSESSVVTTKGIRQVLPISYDEYQRLMSKPYKEPLKYQAWRLFTSTESNSFNGKRIAEVILTSTDRKSTYNKVYKIRYIKFPKPIILSDFSTAFGENLSINGYNGSENNYSNSEAAEKYQAWLDYLDSEAYAEATTGMTEQEIEEYNEQYLVDHADTMSDVPAESSTIWDPCELDPVIHEEILQRAIELAKIAWAGDISATIQTGQRSE